VQTALQSPSDQGKRSRRDFSLFFAYLFESNQAGVLPSFFKKRPIKASEAAAIFRFSLLTCSRYLLQILSDLKSPLLRSAKGAFSAVTPWVAASNYLLQLIADDLLIFPE